MNVNSPKRDSASRPISSPDLMPCPATKKENENYASIQRRTAGNIFCKMLLHGPYRDPEAEKEAGLQASEGCQRVGTEFSGNPAGRSVYDL